MVPAFLIIGALLGGLAAGWIMRAENGRGRGGSKVVGAPAPPYDWQTDEPTDEQIAQIMAACPPAEGFDPEPDQ